LLGPCSFPASTLPLSTSHPINNNKQATSSSPPLAHPHAPTHPTSCQSAPSRCHL
jgi:hypothetical protein